MTKPVKRRFEQCFTIKRYDYRVKRTIRKKGTLPVIGQKIRGSSMHAFSLPGVSHAGWSMEDGQQQ
jgi:hypothetical protein